MKTKFYKNAFYALAVALGLTTLSCQEDESLLKDDKPVVSLELLTPSVTEGEPIQFILNVDRESRHQIDFRVSLENTSTGEMTDLDFTDFSDPDEFFADFGKQSAIEPFTTSKTFSINTVKDFIIEGTENFNLVVSNISKGKGFINDLKMTVAVENFSSDELGLALEWNIDANNQDVENCDMDFDIYTGPYFTWNGPCFEFLNEDIPGNADTGVLADGIHTIESDFWNGGDAWLITPVMGIDITFTVAKIGQFEVTHTYEDLYPSDLLESAFGGDGYMTLGTVEVVGGKYTVYDKDGNMIGQE